MGTLALLGQRHMMDAAPHATGARMHRFLCVTVRDFMLPRAAMRLQPLVLTYLVRGAKWSATALASATHSSACAPGVSSCPNLTSTTFCLGDT